MSNRQEREMTYLQITLNIPHNRRAAAAEVYQKYKDRS